MGEGKNEGHILKCHDCPPQNEADDNEARDDESDGDAPVGEDLGGRAGDINTTIHEHS